MAVAETVVSFLVERLADELIQDINLFRSEREQLKWVQREFTRMECFLKDVDARAEANEQLKNWKREVRDAAYSAEDIIDTFVVEIIPLKQPGFLGRVKRYAFILKELWVRRSLASEIEMLKIDLKSISESRAAYHIEYMVGAGHGASSTTVNVNQSLRDSSPDVEESDFVGFEKDVETLTRWLTGDGERGRSVMGVVGMGGLGKTTLVRKVFNSDAVQKKFRYCIWLSISQVYVVEELLRAVIRSCMVLPKGEYEEVKDMRKNELRRKISSHLEKDKEERYLVVLDDVWKPNAWHELKGAFPDAQNGSRVLITTRNEDVASVALSRVHKLGFLGPVDSWNLFLKKAFLGRDAGFSDDDDIQELAKKAVGNCHGLPLAIVVLGGLLSRKDQSEWESVLQSINWQFVEGEVQMSGILSLSYKDLPYYLKPCFLYLGIFPEDYEFQAKKLIKLWAAEGLLQPRGDHESSEKAGEDYLKELIQRSLVQVATRSSTRAVKSCRIHDTTRDLCISEAKKERFLEINGKDIAAGPSYARCRARRLAIHQDGSYSLDDAIPNLRSILILKPGICELLDRKEKKLFSGSFKLLRVLDVNQAQVINLPSEIGELIHLRYLGFTGCLLRSLPSSIGNLINLQTLVVESFPMEVEIPSTIGKMKQLKHLQFKGHCQGVIKGQPRFDGMSHSLQSLGNVWAGKWLYSGCLRGMINLRKLGIIFYSAEGRCVGKDEWDPIVELESLESLSVSLYAPSLDARENLELVPLNHLHRLHNFRLSGALEKPLESSHFPSNLRKLSFTFTLLKQDPLPILRKLENLRFLKLGTWSYVGKEMACPAGGFPKLQCLYLDTLNNLEEWKVESRSMPVLSHLQIRRCKEMKMVPEGVKDVTSLKTFEIWGMGFVFSNRVRRDQGEDWPYIQHIPFIDVQ
ncbi:hypothetical protein ACLOJK_039944 [Asimina triloba]